MTVAGQWSSPRPAVMRVTGIALTIEPLAADTGSPFRGGLSVGWTLKGRQPIMAVASETPVLDTLAAMTIDSLERCSMDPSTLVLTRLAALCAMDAPPISYLAHVGPAQEANVTIDQVQDLLVAIAPVVGTARVMSAAGHITEALGFAIAVADSGSAGAE